MIIGKFHSFAGFHETIGYSEGPKGLRQYCGQTKTGTGCGAGSTNAAARADFCKKYGVNGKCYGDTTSVKKPAYIVPYKGKEPYVVPYKGKNTLNASGSASVGAGAGGSGSTGTVVSKANDITSSILPDFIEDKIPAGFPLWVIPIGVVGVLALILISKR